MESLKEYFLLSVTLYGWLLYWVPMAVCIVGYTIDDFNEFAVERIRRDKARAGESSYTPELTTGKIFGRYVLSIIPVVNLLVVVFGFGPRYLSTWFDLLRKLFDTPMVPWTEEDEKARTAAYNIKREKDKEKQQ